MPKSSRGSPEKSLHTKTNERKIKKPTVRKLPGEGKDPSQGVFEKHASLSLIPLSSLTEKCATTYNWKRKKVTGSRPSSEKRTNNKGGGPSESPEEAALATQKSEFNYISPNDLRGGINAESARSPEGPPVQTTSSSGKATEGQGKVGRKAVVYSETKNSKVLER